MRLITIILAICLSLLISTGLQFICTMGTVDYDIFTTFQWFFQLMYWIAAICIGLIIERTEYSS
jgi:hypothetical protein